MLGIVLFTIPAGYVIKIAIDYFCPGLLKKVAVKSYWNILQLSSRAELKIQDTYKTIIEYIPILGPVKTPMIKFISDGDEIKTYTINEFMKTDHISTNYDFVLYEMPVKDNIKYNTYMFRYEDYNDVIPIEYKSSNEFNFLSIKLLHYKNDAWYNINFGNIYFLIPDNILFDYAFLKWYLYKYHSVWLDRTDTYLVSFIDHNMNYITFTEKEYIIIRKNNYEIKMI
jgi:hypothetical protein